MTHPVFVPVQPSANQFRQSIENRSITIITRGLKTQIRNGHVVLFCFVFLDLVPTETPTTIPPSESPTPPPGITNIVFNFFFSPYDKLVQHEKENSDWFSKRSDVCTTDR